MIRLAYLSPQVLEHVVNRRVPPAISLNDLVAVVDRPWEEQANRVFNMPINQLQVTKMSQIVR